MANVLPFDKQVAAIAALTEGVSVRAAERLTNVNRGTILSLGIRVGMGCAILHDRLMRNLRVGILEFDEVWSYIGKKQKRLKPDDLPEKGDCYIFAALDAVGKAIISYRIGKRTAGHTVAFAADVRKRVLGAPQISSDGYSPYVNAIEDAFGADCHYAQIIKSYEGEPGPTAARRYSPGWVVGVEKTRVSGNPDPRKISTSYVERSNLTIRMQSRRFTRLTNAFSKKLENHAAAVALYVAHYNFCRVHEALRITPAMQLGVTDHIWTIAELVQAALDGVLAPEPQPPIAQAGGDETATVRPARPTFTVIQGGRA